MNIETELNDNQVISRLTGKLTNEVITNHGKEIDLLKKNADKEIILDCTKLESVSYSGLRMFLSLKKYTIEQGGEIIIKGGNTDIIQLFNVTGFHSFFTFK